MSDLNYKGVFRNGSKYHARLLLAGRRCYVGSFDTELEAAQCYDYALTFFSKNFPVLPAKRRFNFPESDSFLTCDAYWEACQQAKVKVEYDGILPEYDRARAATEEAPAVDVFDRLDQIEKRLDQIEKRLESFESAMRHTLQALGDKIAALDCTYGSNKLITVTPDFLSPPATTPNLETIITCKQTP